MQKILQISDSENDADRTVKFFINFDEVCIFQIRVCDAQGQSEKILKDFQA